ncbi:MAG: SDR family NAD(P)-dependent oxidoreductase [Lewinellaceae bacterium]|nr:SDR family NAD(P)-dependent oxidoreductase [Lewinellaceae bacterium]
MKLTKNTILITGGTSGIGYELGKSLLEKNNKVILLGRNPAKLQEAASQGFQAIQCDLSDTQEIENAVIRIQNKYPDVNILINNAGVQYNYLFTEEAVSPDRIRKEMDINAAGQIILTQLLIPLLATSPKALIINTTSGLGAFPKSDGLVYSASKAAMRNFTTGLRFALKDTAINVLEFIPPVTDTGMTSGRDEKKMPVKALISHVIPQIEKERRVVTVPSMRIFLRIAFLFPALAHKILDKK